jgi:hypothetical protein
MNKYQFDQLRALAAPKVLSGNADADVSAAAYNTGYVELFNLVTHASKGITDLVIDLDFNGGATGWDDISTANDTMNVGVYRKVGTAYKCLELSAAYTATGDGTHLSAGRRFNIGAVGPGETISVRIKVSAERADFTIPYKLTYRGEVAPTVTAVVAG